MGIEIKTIGELIDEATKAEIRAEKTGLKQKNEAADYVLGELPINVLVAHLAETMELWAKLLEVNRVIWDLIDDVTAFDLSILHLGEQLVWCISAAQEVQRQNRVRTDTIRKINELAGETHNVPAKIHKGI